MRLELAKPDDEVIDYADIRQRQAWLLTALRHQRARESDLIYEAYCDAFDTDLIAGGKPNHRRPGSAGSVGTARVRNRRPPQMSQDGVPAQ